MMSTLFKVRFYPENQTRGRPHEAYVMQVGDDLNMRWIEYLCWQKSGRICKIKKILKFEGGDNWTVVYRSE